MKKIILMVFGILMGYSAMAWILFSISSLIRGNDIALIVEPLTKMSICCLAIAVMNTIGILISSVYSKIWERKNDL